MNIFFSYTVRDGLVDIAQLRRIAKRLEVFSCPVHRPFGASLRGSSTQRLECNSPCGRFSVVCYTSGLPFSLGDGRMHDCSKIRSSDLCGVERVLAFGRARRRYSTAPNQSLEAELAVCQPFFPRAFKRCHVAFLSWLLFSKIL